MKGSLGASERIRQLLGGLVLAGLRRSRLASTPACSPDCRDPDRKRRNSLARKLGAGGIAADSKTAVGADGQLVLPVEGTLPPLDGLGPWINSPALTRESLARQVW